MTTRTSLATRTLRGGAAVAFGVGLVAVSAPASAAPNSFPLNVGQETTGSDTGAHGFFSYTISDDELCYTMSVRNLSAPATAAHVHIAPRKTAGPIVIPLNVGPGTTFTLSECVTADAALLADLDSNPRAYYVNVHTPTFPGGEVRGQFTH